MSGGEVDSFSMMIFNRSAIGTMRCGKKLEVVFYMWPD